MPKKSLSDPAFIRPAELMGADIQAALTSKSEEVADMIVKGLGRKNGKLLAEAKAKVAKVYKGEGLVDINRARLVKIMNRGANETADASLLKRVAGIDNIIDNLGGVVSKSAESYIDRIVMNKVTKKLAAGGNAEEVREVVRKSMADAEHYWKNVSNTATSRAYHYGGMLGAEKSGLKYCTYIAVVDDRTTDFCKSIDGKRITLANAMVKAEVTLSKSADEMLNDDFWAIAAELGERGSTALVTNGLTLPPFHGHCRTTIHYT